MLSHVVASRRACVLFGFSGLIFGRLGFGFSGLVCGVGIADIDCEVQMLAFVPKMNLLAGLYLGFIFMSLLFSFQLHSQLKFCLQKVVERDTKKFCFSFF